MIIELGDRSGQGRRLWEAYAAAGYSASGHIGFRAFVAAAVPDARVSGTTQEGLVLKFTDEISATIFSLKWL